MRVPRQVSLCPGLLPCRLTPRSRQWTALGKLTLFNVMLCNVMLCHVMTGSHVIFSCHLVKLGVLFPDITLTNCWKVRAEVELEK